MLPQIHGVSLSTFRKRMADALSRVTRDGGNLWLYRRGRPVAAVVRMVDAEMLAKLQGRSLDELLHRADVDRERVIAAKQVEDTPQIATKGWAYPPSDIAGFDRQLAADEGDDRAVMPAPPPPPQPNGGG